MERNSLAIDINLIFPIILLFLFIVLPALLKRLGQYTVAGKNAERPSEHEQEALPEERMREYFDELTMKHADKSTQKESFSNKPIHPKWF